MKHFYSSILIVFLSFLYLGLNAQLGETYFLYPGVTEINRVYHAPFTPTPPSIDGDPSDPVWDLAPWRKAQTYSKFEEDDDWRGGTPVEPEGSFAGESDLLFEWKMLWDNSSYYLLMKHVDDKIIYSDNHNGYPGYGNVTPSAFIWVGPAAGAGDGSSYHYWRMDHISLWLTYWNETFYNEKYTRASDGVLQSFYPGAIHSSHPDAVLWAAKHRGGENHVGTVAASHKEGTNERYFEFKDSDWGSMFVNKPGFSVKVGDTLLFNGEINEADGTTNRNDYHLGISTEEGNGYSVLKYATLIILSETPTNVGVINANRTFEIYPNPNKSGMLRFNKETDISIYCISGKEILKASNVSQIDISSLERGMYLVKDKSGITRKLIKE